MRLFFILFLLAPPVSAADFTPSTVSQLLQKARSKSLTERLEHFSLRFVGAPFFDDPLGEGPRGEYDRDPLFRVDRFDCTTFVETVIALSLSRTPHEFESVLKRIRYHNGDPTFTERNHFPDADWIPNNTAAGFVTDITAEVAGAIGVKTATITVTKKGWYAALNAKTLQGVPAAETARRLAKLHREGAHLAPQTVSLPYLAFDKILQRSEIPEAEKVRRKAEEEIIVEKYQTMPPVITEEQREQRAQAQHAELVALRQNYVLAESEVDTEILRRIPSGTILNVVRPDWKIPGSALSITHQGFVIHKQGIIYFRHGSRSGGARLKDVTLASYLKICLLSPSIKGINLLRVNAQH